MSTYLEEQAKAHPLVVSVRLAVVRLAAGVVHARVRDRDAHFLLERLPDGVRGVDPAVRVQHVLGYVLCVHAVDGVAHVLPRGDDQAERGQQHHGQAVVEPEHGRVDVHVADFHQALQAPEHVKHGVPGRRDVPSVSPAFPNRSAGLSAPVARGRQGVHDGRPASRETGDGGGGEPAAAAADAAAAPVVLVVLVVFAASVAVVPPRLLRRCPVVTDEQRCLKHNKRV